MLGWCSNHKGICAVPEVIGLRSQQVQSGRLAMYREGLPEAMHQLMALRWLLLSPLLRQNYKAEIWHMARFVPGDRGHVCQLTALDGRARAGKKLHWGWDCAAWL